MNEITPRSAPISSVNDRHHWAAAAVVCRETKNDKVSFHKQRHIHTHHKHTHTHTTHAQTCMQPHTHTCTMHTDTDRHSKRPVQRAVKDDISTSTNTKYKHSTYLHCSQMYTSTTSYCRHEQMKDIKWRYKWTSFGEIRDCKRTENIPSLHLVSSCKPNLLQLTVYLLMFIYNTPSLIQLLLRATSDLHTFIPDPWFKSMHPDNIYFFYDGALQQLLPRRRPTSTHGHSRYRCFSSKRFLRSHLP